MCQYKMRLTTKYILIFFTFIFLTFSVYGQDNNIIDLCVKGNLTIKLIRLDNELCYQIQKSKYSKTINLDRQNIIWKAFPQIVWTNDKYACALTFWTGPISYYLFLPLDKNVDLQYFTKNIVETDSINNNICFVDSVTDNSAIFTVQNLITKKKKLISAKLNEKNWIYPFYETIIMTKNTVKIITTIETLTLDIKEINIGT